LKTLNIKE